MSIGTGSIWLRFRLFSSFPFRSTYVSLDMAQLYQITKRPGGGAA